jgi:uracil phosphoribosyltransferase
MLDVFLNLVPEASVGKILIQRNEETSQPILYYSKLPSLVTRNIVLLDPMLATGGSAIAAIKVLLENGAEEEKIVFFNVVCCPAGVKKLYEIYPKFYYYYVIIMLLLLLLSLC